MVDNVSLGPGTLVETTFNYQIIRAAYSYSFFQDDRMDLAGSFGLFVMPIKFEMNASGLGSSEGDFSFTAPLPAFGLRGDFAITPRWMLRTNFDFFYLEYESFRGALVDARVAVEYNPWDHFGFGLGLDSFKLRLSAEDDGLPVRRFPGEHQVPVPRRAAVREVLFLDGQERGGGRAASPSSRVDRDYLPGRIGEMMWAGSFNVRSTIPRSSPPTAAGSSGVTVGSSRSPRTATGIVTSVPPRM